MQTEPVAVMSRAILAAPLSHFSLLTSLWLTGNGSLPMGNLAEQLGRLPGLEDLSLVDLHVSQPGQMHACFAPLTQLRFLFVEAWPVTAEMVKEFAEAMSGMTQLENCDFNSCDCSPGDASKSYWWYAEVEWYTGLLSLPTRGSYSFGCYNAESVLSDVEDVVQLLSAKGATVKFGAGGELMSICFAVNAG